MKRITVLLADDHTIVREGLRALMKQEADIHVVGEAENGRLAVSLTRTLKPDVLVMDIAMPILNGIEATRQIALDKGTTKILILSAYSETPYVEKVLALGASGFLIKQSAFRVLPEAIRAIHSGKTYFSPAIASRVDPTQLPNKKGLEKPLLFKLTRRESEVLQLIAEGNANKMIADILNISIKTVEKHRQSLMEKLGVHDTAGLTRYAIAKGVVESMVQVKIL